MRTPEPDKVPTLLFEFKNGPVGKDQQWKT